MKILIITQHIFPIKTPRAHRSTELIKEFAKQGHHVTAYAVLGSYNYSWFKKQHAVKIKNIPVHFELHPYSSDGDGKRMLIDKILGKVLGKTFEFPTIEFKYSIPKIIKKEQDFDLLISIGAPHHIHWGCARAKQKKLFSYKWIADCGDPYMNNGTSTDHLQKFAEQEHLFCQLCDYITVPVEKAKNGYYQEYRNKIRVIPQGFDFDFPIKENEPHNPITQFAYAGMFYKDIRNPQKILDYVSNLEIDFRFHVFTPFPQILDSFKEKFGEKLIIHTPIERNLLLNTLKTMDFLLNIENVNSPNQVPSKLIDYAITGRPILSLNPENPDINAIDAFLNKEYTRQKKIENINQYQIKEVAKRFLDLTK